MGRLAGAAMVATNTPLVRAVTAAVGAADGEHILDTGFEPGREPAAARPPGAGLMSLPLQPHAGCRQWPTLRVAGARRAARTSVGSGGVTADDTRNRWFLGCGRSSGSRGRRNAEGPLGLGLFVLAGRRG